MKAQPKLKRKADKEWLDQIQPSKTNGARAKQNASFAGFINPAMAGSIRVAIDNGDRINDHHLTLAEKQAARGA